MKLFALGVFFAAAAAAQMTPVAISEMPPADAATTINFFNGSNQLQYACLARSLQPKRQISLEQGNLVSVVVSAGTATVTTSANHGYQVANPFVVQGSATSALNGNYQIVTVASATTFTFTTGAPNGTYTDPALIFTAPSTAMPVWSVKLFTYSGSNLTLIQTAGGVNASAVCDNRATLAYQ